MPKLKSITTKMKNLLEGFNSRFELTEITMSKPEKELRSSRQKNKKIMKKNKQSLRDTWDTIKCTNTCIMVSPKVEERKGQKEYLEKKMTPKSQI